MGRTIILLLSCVRKFIFVIHARKSYPIHRDYQPEKERETAEASCHRRNICCLPLDELLFDGSIDLCNLSALDPSE
jgi:hypothetical protein